MKTLTKEEMLARITGRHLSQVNEGCFNLAVSECLRAMSEFSDQENARLTAINEKQAELMERFVKETYIPICDYGVYKKLKSEIQSLQSGKEVDTCIHFDCCQGRNKCLASHLSPIISDTCIGVDCGHYEDFNIIKIDINDPDFNEPI